MLAEREHRVAYAVPSFRNWQYLSMRVAAKMAYTSMRIILVYECNAHVVYFAGAQLFNTYAISNDRRIKIMGE